MKQFSPLTKPFWGDGEERRKWVTIKMAGVIKQWSSVMLAFFTMLYREYCRARLAEMRRHRLKYRLVS